MSQAGFIDQNHEGAPGLGWARPFTTDCGDPVLNPCSSYPYQFGNIPRETEAITGPLYEAEDVSLIKDFHLTSKVAFQLKGEAFDVFNRHRMGLPDLTPATTQGSLFGVPTGTDYGPRNMQVTGRINF